jgi:DNA-binding GntR family transcriptional regulator
MEEVTVNTNEPGAELFKPAPRFRPLRHDAYDALREAILLSRLKPGARIVEADVARQMGISRGPIREAMGQLEQDGLVEYQPRRGVIVAQLTRERVLDAYVVRANLESLAAELAARQIERAGSAELEDRVERMARCAQQGDATGFFQGDVAFHRQMCELAGNRVLLRLWNSLGPHAWTLFSGMQQQGYSLPRLVERHRTLLAAVRSGDPAHAASNAREHILEIAYNVIDHLYPQGERHQADRQAG